ncbi:MAG TPA: aromatic ring-hydroxylating dioxygenase subunit alpha [Candidatus Dormibacteraeota bacterium]
MIAAQQPTAAAVAAYHAALERFWQPVCAADAVADRPHFVQLLGRPLTVVRLDGRIACFDDVCRHMGASLSLASVVAGPHGAGEVLRCAYHGWSYDVSGRCVDIPARRDAPIPRDARVRAYPATERYGLVWVCLAGEAASGIPEFPEYDDPRFHMTPLRVYEPWLCSAPRIVMGALDDTHFPWVHPGLLGDPDHPEPPDHSAYLEGDYLVSTYSTLQPANETISGAGGSGGLETVSYTNWCTASSIRLLKAGPAGRYSIYEVVCPIAHDRSLIFLRMARDFDTDPARDADYVAFEDVIQEQDRPVVESQRPWLLPPLSSRLMLYVRPADLPLVAYQKWMEQLGVPQI